MGGGSGAITPPREAAKKPSRDADGKLQQTKVDIAPRLGYPLMTKARHLKLVGGYTALCKMQKGLDPITRDLCKFITSLTIIPAAANVGGITWAALDLLYKIHCGESTAMGLAKGTIRPSVMKMLNQFKSRTRDVIGWLIHDDDKACWKAVKPRASRLMPLGYTNHTPSVCFLPAIPDDIAHVVAEALLSITKHLSMENLAALRGNHYTRIPKPFPRRGDPKWDAF